MTAQQWFVVSAGALALAAGGVAFHAHRSRCVTEAATAELVRESTRLRTALQQRATARRNVAPNTLSAKTPPSRPSTPRAGAAGATQAEEAWKAALLADPVLQSLWSKAERCDVRRSYALFYGLAGLSGVDIARFEALMVRHRELLLDLKGTWRAQGEGAGGAVTSLGDEALREHAAQLRELLGPEGYKRLQTYERAANIRPTVEGWVGAMAVAGVPLSSGQTERLLDTLQRLATPAFPGAKAIAVPWDTFDQQVQPFLTPEQFAILRNGLPAGTNFTRFDLQFYAAVARARYDEKARADTPNPPLRP